MKHICLDMNINSIILPIVLYMARYQQLIVSCHFLEWKLSFPGVGTIVSFKGNSRFSVRERPFPNGMMCTGFS